MRVIASTAYKMHGLGFSKRSYGQVRFHWKKKKNVNNLRRLTWTVDMDNGNRSNLVDNLGSPGNPRNLGYGYIRNHCAIHSNQSDHTNNGNRINQGNLDPQKESWSADVFPSAFHIPPFLRVSKWYQHKHRQHSVSMTRNDCRASSRGNWRKLTCYSTTFKVRNDR